MFTTMLAFAVVPFGPVKDAPSWLRFIIAPNIDIGIVFIFAVGSLAVYGVILGGWASNNKYSALGSLRASAQVISYEIPLGMSVLGVVLLSGTLNLEAILEQQAAGGFWSWNIWFQPLACLIFYHQLAGRVESAAVRSCRSASRSWSAATTPSTAACGWCCFSSASTRTSSRSAF